jgi:tripartite-type tricarboxylate transporter receptor subunit TctC
MEIAMRIPTFHAHRFREINMKIHRRHFLSLAAGAGALPIVSQTTMAQAYPARPVRLVVPFAPGGFGDIVARLVGQRLGDRLGQPIVVENRVGGAGNVAHEAVAASPPDGYTILLVVPANTINAALYEKPNFNVLHHITPVASMMQGALVMAVNPSFPAKTVPEFIAYAKAKPGALNFASGGNATGAHVSTALFMMMAGIKMVHVPYRGGEGPALSDLIGGQVQVMFSNLPPSIQHFRSGSLRALAVTTATRSAALPEIPTVGDFLAGYEASVWLGVGAPKNTPAIIVDALNREINAVLADPEIRARLASMGGTIFLGSPAAFGQFIGSETEKWAKVIRAANIKAG